jgi:hypothetical protein
MGCRIAAGGHRPLRVVTRLWSSVLSTSGGRRPKRVIHHNELLAMKRSFEACGKLAFGRRARSAVHESKYQKPFEHPIATCATHCENILRLNSGRLPILHLVRLITRCDATQRAVVLGRSGRRVGCPFMVERTETIAASAYPRPATLPGTCRS